MGTIIRFQSSRVGMRVVILLTTLAAVPSRSRFTIISPIPNTPIATVTKPTPSINSRIPKVYRWAPEFTSVPMTPRIRPRTIMPMALSSEPRARTTEQTRPSTMREKYSAGPNLRATLARGGANRTMTKVVKVPAKNEPMAEVARATPARPWSAIWYPSRQVTMEEASPGRFTRIEVVEPPYCAP